MPKIEVGPQGPTYELPPIELLKDQPELYNYFLAIQRSIEEEQRYTLLVS